MLVAGIRSLAVCLVVVATWTSVRASAQTEEELAALRVTFGEGVAATQEERWDDAVTAFRAVIAVRDTTPVKYNLAFALSHTDAIGEAADLLDQVLSDPELDDAMRSQALTVLEALVPRMAHLTIQLAGDEAGMTVLLDGEEVGLGDLGRAVRIAPGAHEVVLRRGETELSRRSVSLAEGGREEIMLLDSDVSDADQSGGGGSTTDITSEWWFWTIIGGAAVAVGIGIIVGISVSADGEAQPISGNLDPGVLRVMP